MTTIAGLHKKFSLMQAQINGFLVYSTHRQTMCPGKYFVFIEM